MNMKSWKNFGLMLLSGVGGSFIFMIVGDASYASPGFSIGMIMYLAVELEVI